MTLVRISDRKSRRNQIAPSIEKLAGLANAHALQVGVGRHANLALERPGKIKRAQRHHSGKFGKGNVFGEIRLQLLARSPNRPPLILNRLWRHWIFGVMLDQMR